MHTATSLPPSVLVKRQRRTLIKWSDGTITDAIFTGRKDEDGFPIAQHPGAGVSEVCRADIRWDDECGNRHNTFSITGVCGGACGCIHDDIAKHFPALRPLLKWHGVNSDGPFSYLGNTVYHAGDLDYNGLRAGEVSQLRNGRTGEPSWIRNGTPTEYANGPTKPADVLASGWEPWTRTGEGKPRDLPAARSCAVWSDATDADLTASPHELRAALLARLPALMVEFKTAVESLGFTY